MASSLGDLTRRRAADHPDRTVFTYQDRTITYGELDARSNRVAHGLRDAGVGPDDRVAFLDKNCPEFFEILFGGTKLGAVNVAVNWRLAPQEILYTLNDARAKVLFCGEEFLPQLAEIEDEIETLQSVVALGKS